MKTGINRLFIRHKRTVDFVGLRNVIGLLAHLFRAKGCGHATDGIQGHWTPRIQCRVIGGHAMGFQRIDGCLVQSIADQAMMNARQ